MKSSNALIAVMAMMIIFMAGAMVILGRGFRKANNRIHHLEDSIHGRIRYDTLGTLEETPEWCPVLTGIKK